MTLLSVKAGDRIGGYELERVIGEGGCGQVWLAKHSVLPDCRAALKLPRDPELIDLLRRESLIQHKIEHPGVVKILGVDLDARVPYLALEHVPGGDLGTLLSSVGKLPPLKALRIFREVLEILRFAHARGVIHRDLKPSNILLDESGRARVSDFGLGKCLEEVSASRLRESIPLGADSRSGRSGGGTWEYMAPEQRAGAPADGRCDLYALGVILYEMLAGERPSGRVGLEAVSPRLDRIFARCYTSLPRRYRSAAEVLADLERAEKEVAAGPPANSRRAPAAARPAWFRAAAGFFSIVGMVACAFVLCALLSPPEVRSGPIAALKGWLGIEDIRYADPPSPSPQLLASEEKLRRLRVLDRSRRRERYQVELVSVRIDEETYRRQFNAPLEPGQPDLYVRVFQKREGAAREFLVFDSSARPREGWSVEWTYSEGRFAVEWKARDELRLEVWESDLFGDNRIFELRGGDPGGLSMALLSRPAVHPTLKHRIHLRSDFEFP